jgi:hypothetical protein
MKPKKLNLSKRTIVLLNEGMSKLNGGFTVNNLDSEGLNTTPKKTCIEALTQKSCALCSPTKI